MLRLAMNNKQENNPLHGITLEAVVTSLVDYYGWHELSKKIDINCFKSNPSIKSFHEYVSVALLTSLPINKALFLIIIFLVMVLVYLVVLVGDLV